LLMPCESGPCIEVAHDARSLPSLTAPSLTAPCIHQAYAGLDIQDIHLSRVTPNGTRISYLDKDFLESTFSGVIKCEISSATIVAEKQWWNPFSLSTFKGDPYVVATIDGASSMTNTIWGDVTPNFDTTLYFFVKDKGSSRLLLRLMDDNVAVTDHEIGKALVPLGGLEEGQRQDFELPMGTQGSTLKCSITYASLIDNGQIENLVLAEEDSSKASEERIETLFASCSAVLESRWRLFQATIHHDGDAFLPVAFIENDESDTQAWVFWAKSRKQVCISFRGTEQTEWRDVLSDLNLVPTPICFDEGRIQVVDSSTGDNDMWVHRGFLDAFLSVAAEVREIIVRQIGEREPGEWTVFTTGHSLGGALSTLAAFELAARSKESGVFKNVLSYSFGSPMVGNEAFCEEFNGLVPTCYRFANEKDAVTFVPRMIGFSHVGTKAILFDGGDVQFDDEKGVGENVTSEDLVKTLAARMLPSIASDGDGSVDVEEILEAEIEALLGLLEGGAVQEHMEDAYFDRLRETLRRS
jgi:predicted lipase